MLIKNKGIEKRIKPNPPEQGRNIKSRNKKLSQESTLRRKGEK